MATAVIFPALLILILIKFVVFDVIGFVVEGNADKSVFSVVAVLQTLSGNVRCVDVATL